MYSVEFQNCRRVCNSTFHQLLLCWKLEVGIGYVKIQMFEKLARSLLIPYSLRFRNSFGPLNVTNSNHHNSFQYFILWTNLTSTRLSFLFALLRRSLSNQSNRYSYWRTENQYFSLTAKLLCFVKIFFFKLSSNNHPSVYEITLYYSAKGKNNSKLFMFLIRFCLFLFQTFIAT